MYEVPRPLPSRSRALSSITARTFGRYRLERRLAYGGMAEILLAVELRSGRQVVLKRILPHYAANPEFVQYFVHEGRLGARLRHPNLVETLEAGRVGDTCYIALEYLRGQTAIEMLRAAARAGVELPLGVAVRVVADAARGLHHAHTAISDAGHPLGVVHRDVTPHNLFVCVDGTTKVLDFGIAKAASQLHHTRTGTIKGKFSYLAPEQVRGEPIDHRVDVFALGIVLHELLTLKPLFRGANDAETLQRILTLEVQAPERLRKCVPPGLGAVALRALQRDRDRRLPSAAALADSIEAVAEAECIDASREVVAQLVSELCPTQINDLAPPPRIASAPKPRPRVPPLPRSTTPTPLPLPPPPGPVLDALPFDPAAPVAPVELPPTQPERPSALPLEERLELREIRSTPIEIPLESQLAPVETVEVPPEAAIEPALEIVAEPAVAVGNGSGSASTISLDAMHALLEPRRRLERRLMMAAGVLALAIAAIGMRGACLRAATAPPKVTVLETQKAIAPPEAEPALPPVAAPPVRPSRSASLRLVTDGPATVLVDGQPTRAAADGLYHLSTGRHRIVVAGAHLAQPRSFELSLAPEESVVRQVRSGRGRLRVAVTPWAEVIVDGRAVGTTPLAALELQEGWHQVVLKNGELGALVRRKIVVPADKETLVRVDLFNR